MELSRQECAVRTVLAAGVGRGAGFIPILDWDGHDLAWTNGYEIHPGRAWTSGYNGIDSMIENVTAEQYTLGWAQKKGINNSGSSAGNPAWNDNWCIQGYPDPGTFSGTASTLRQFDDTMTGAIRHGGNVSPASKFPLWFAGNGTSNSYVSFMLYDRVAAYDNCPLNTSTQTMTNTLTPQRYVATPGLQIMAYQHTTASVATVPTINALTYTNQSGASIVSTFASYPVSNNNIAGSTTCGNVDSSNNSTPQPWWPLNAGDTGVQNIVSYHTSVTDTGTICFVLAQPICYLAFDGTAGHGFMKAMHKIGLNRVYDGAHLSFMTCCTSGLTDRVTAAAGFGWA